MKKREWLIFAVVLCIVYSLYRGIVSSIIMPSSMSDTNELINNEHVSPQELYKRSWETVKNSYIDSDYNSQNWGRWKNRYKGKLKTDEDARVAIETMLASLDDNYTRFLSKKEYAEQFNSIDAHITGIGVNIMSQSGKTVVYSVIEDTPASRAGLKPDDIILEVDGKDINGMDIVKVSEMIRGKENSAVKIKLKRGDNILIKNIIRKKIEIKSIDVKIQKNNIGYIRIKSFIGTNTTKDFSDALNKVKNTDGVILDLRGNSGGLLVNAIVTANMLFDNGKIVSIVYKNGVKKDIKAQENVSTLHKPIVVLIDGGSASASEILSGALKDNKKAVLVGTKTFGKGLVQQIVPLPNGTGINITVAKYLTPSGADINKKGIEPDYKVEFSMKDFNNKKDTQLNKAESIIEKLCHN